MSCTVQSFRVGKDAGIADPSAKKRGAPLPTMREIEVGKGTQRCAFIERGSKVPWPTLQTDP
jgi:hypothetical protein